MHSKLAILAILLITSLGFSQQYGHTNHSGHEVDANPAPVPPQRSANTYEIYSLLLPGAPLDRTTPTMARNWAVANTTVNISDMNPAIPPDGQLKAPVENEKAFEQALADFDARKYERFHLTAKGFGHAHAPKLIDSEQAEIIRKSGHGGIVSFSAVYFNDNQTAALVYVNQWCANLCSAGQWVYLEKQDGQWVRRSGIAGPGV